MRDVVRRVEVGIAAGGRGIIVLVQGYRGLEASSHQAGKELTRGECSRVQRVGQVGLMLVKCPVGIVVLVVPHAAELSEGSGFDAKEPSGG